MNSIPPAVVATKLPPVVSTPPRAVTTLPAQAHSDDHLVDLWLHGRSPGTQRAYAADVLAFCAHVGCTLPQVTFGDLQAFQDSLA